MPHNSPQIHRLHGLLKITEAELYYLKRCSTRLFASDMTQQRISELPDDDGLSEQVDAFVARFGRLQDTLGDKLLPAFLYIMQERTGTVLENLDRAEKLGLVASADYWLVLRKLRNRMIHEYVCDHAELLDALLEAHHGISLLEQTFTNIQQRLLQSFPEISDIPTG